MTGIPDPFVLTPGGSTPTITFTNNATVANGNSFQRQNNRGIGGGGGIFGGDFTTNTPLLISVGNDASSALTLTFSSPVSEIGFNFEPTGYLSANAATFTFNVFQGGVSSSFTSNSVTTRNRQDGSAPFFGAQVTGGVNSITSVQVYGVSSTGNSSVNADDFVISPVGVRISATTPVPEPGVLALLAGAALPMGLLAACRRRR